MFLYVLGSYRHYGVCIDYDDLRISRLSIISGAKIVRRPRNNNSASQSPPPSFFLHQGGAHLATVAVTLGYSCWYCLTLWRFLVYCLRNRAGIPQNSRGITLTAAETTKFRTYNDDDDERLLEQKQRLTQTFTWPTIIIPSGHCLSLGATTFEF